MRRILNDQYALAVHLLILAAIISVGGWYASTQKADVVEQLGAAIGHQESILLTLANTTDRNDVDESVGRLIVDCRDRGTFERLLNDLTSLTKQELITLQQLFDSCGDYYALRKAVMISQMQRELENLQEYASLYALLRENTRLAGEVSSWSSLVAFETERSELITEQVAIQGDIISLLIKGSRVNSNDVTDKVKRAQNISERLLVLDRQIDDLRLSFEL